MFLSKLFKKKEKNTELETRQEGVMKPKPLAEIFLLDDKDAFVSEMYTYIGDKCQWGDRVEVLSGPERVFYVGQLLETEVNNGGFDQFFYNSSGDYAGELEDCLQQIGAVKTAAICRKALETLGGELPTDCEARREWMEENQTDEMTDALEECDDAFYAYEEDLAALNQAFVLSHRAEFT